MFGHNLEQHELDAAGSLCRFRFTGLKDQRVLLSVARERPFCRCLDAEVVYVPFGERKRKRLFHLSETLTREYAILHQGKHVEVFGVSCLLVCKIENNPSLTE